MLTASAARSLTQYGINDTEYIMANVQCKIIQKALEGDSKCWVSFNTSSLKKKSNLKNIAIDVVKILTENGFEAKSETFADAEYEEYLSFDISWEG